MSKRKGSHLNDSDGPQPWGVGTGDIYNQYIRVRSKSINASYKIIEGVYWRSFILA
jgi:hypothetical protein